MTWATDDVDGSPKLKEPIIDRWTPIGVLKAALDQWSEAIEDEDLEVSGADMVEWFFGTFVPSAQEALEGEK